MGAMTNYLENKLIDHVLRNTAYTPPTTLHFALFTSDPTETGAAGTEVSGGSYARVAVTANLTNMAGTQAAGSTTASSGTNGTTSNNGAITFPAPTGNWGTVTHMAIMDAASGGNMLVYGALQTSKVISSGDAAPSFTSGQFTFQIDN